LLQLRTDINKLAKYLVSHRSWSKLSKNWYPLEVEVNCWYNSSVIVDELLQETAKYARHRKVRGEVRLWSRSCVHLLSHRVCISNSKQMRALSRHCVLIKFLCWAKLTFERRRKVCTCNNEHRLINYQPLYAPRDKLRCRVEHSGWLKLEDCLVLIHHYFLVAGKWIEHWEPHMKSGTCG